MLAYSKTRPVRDGLKQQKNAKAKAAYRQKYESDFIIADAAARYFRENGISKLPSYKALQAEIETLIQEKNSGYNDYRQLPGLDGLSHHRRKAVQIPLRRAGHDPRPASGRHRLRGVRLLE